MRRDQKDALESVEDILFFFFFGIIRSRNSIRKRILKQTKLLTVLTRQDEPENMDDERPNK